MTNKEIAKLLRKVAAAYTIKNANRFKIIAYEKAADSIDHLASELKDLASEGKLHTVSGIGPSIASHLDELFKIGKVKHFEQIFSQVPQAIFPLLDLTGFGAKKAYKLVIALNLKDPDTVLDDILKAAKNHKIANIESFGEKSEKDIQEAVESYRNSPKKEIRMPLPYAHAIALDIVSYLKKSPTVEEVATLGSLRRMVSTIGDIDLALATREPQKAIEWFLTYPKKQKVVEKGKEGATIILGGGQQVDLRVVKPQAWGAMLQYFTGSKNHNIHLREFALKKGWSLNEYGIKNIKTGDVSKFSIEENFYKFLSLPWIPPEIREDRGEIEAALAHKLPKLIKLGDVKGDLQIHSNYPIEPSHDLGKNSMEEILEKAKSLGYEHIAFTEHNPSVSKHTISQILTIMKKRKAKIEQLKASTKSVRILNLLEIDISADGRLALPEEAFNFIDAALVSIHSSFNQPKEAMTERVLKGLSHPKAKIFAHPTARLINQRDSISLDFEKIFEFCAKNKKAIEINAYPNRLDLPDILVQEAKKYGVKFTLGTDAHDNSGMVLMPYGVSVARRGWLEKDDILNTLPYNKLINWLTERG